jgi:hypothetical protein
MKPILLIYPPYEGRFFLANRKPFPLGPLSIASYLISKGVDARVMDFSYPPKKTRIPKPAGMKNGPTVTYRDGWTDKEIATWLKDNLHKYHNIIGVSSLMSSFYLTGYKLVDLIKSIANRTTVVMGGPHATVMPEHLASNCLADYVCIGEGEVAFHEFLMGRHSPFILSTHNIRFGKACIPPAGVVVDLDGLRPIKRPCLMDRRETKSLMVTFSRGCPQRCSFCTSHLVQGRGWRRKEPKAIVEELKYYMEYWSASHFEIEDDNLCAGQIGIDWLMEICDRISKEPSMSKLKFHVPHGIPVTALRSWNLVKLLYKTGFRHMVFPIESTDPLVLEDMKKGNIIDSWYAALKNWGRYEKNLPSEVIFGYPFVQTIESMIKTMVDVAKVHSLIWASHFRLNRGTELFDRCVEEGYVNRKTYNPLSMQGFSIETPNFTVKDLKELMAMSRAINYGTELGFDVFHNNVSLLQHKQMSCSYTNHLEIGNIVAEGSFSFKKGQELLAAIAIAKQYGMMTKPIIECSSDGKTLVYKGCKPNKVFRSLNTVLKSYGLTPKTSLIEYSIRSLIAGRSSK